MFLPCFTGAEILNLLPRGAPWFREAVVLNGSPTVMINSSDDEDLFSDVRTGDLIKIKHANEIMESYPPQVNVYSCKIVSKGTADDVDKEVLDELASHGWNYE